MGQLDSSPNNKLFLENRGFILLCGMREGFSLNLAPFRKDYRLIAIGVGRHRLQWKAFILQSFQPASDSSTARRGESPGLSPTSRWAPQGRGRGGRGSRQRRCGGNGIRRTTHTPRSPMCGSGRAGEAATTPREELQPCEGLRCK